MEREGRMRGVIRWEKKVTIPKLMWGKTNPTAYFIHHCFLCCEFDFHTTQLFDYNFIPVVFEKKIFSLN